MSDVQTANEIDSFDDDVFRAIATSEAESGLRPDEPASSGVGEARGGKRASVRDAAASIDNRLHAVAEWMGHLEGVAPPMVWEATSDAEGRKLGLRAVPDEQGRWTIELGLGPDASGQWVDVAGQPITDRIRALRLAESILREVVEQQRRMIQEIRAAVKDFDAAAAALGVRVSK